MTDDAEPWPPPPEYGPRWELCLIGGCRRPRGHDGWPDYGHVGKSCGHVECADEHGHIDACLHDVGWP